MGKPLPRGLTGPLTAALLSHSVLPLAGVRERRAGSGTRLWALLLGAEPGGRECECECECVRVHGPEGQGCRWPPGPLPPALCVPVWLTACCLWASVSGWRCGVVWCGPQAGGVKAPGAWGPLPRRLWAGWVRAVSWPGGGLTVPWPALCLQRHQPGTWPEAGGGDAHLVPQAHWQHRPHLLCLLHHLWHPGGAGEGPGGPGHEVGPAVREEAPRSCPALPTLCLPTWGLRWPWWSSWR